MTITGFINISREELNLEKTLITGQNFRWRQKVNVSKTEWIGILENRFVVQLSQTDNGINYVLLNEDYTRNTKDSFEIHIENALKYYFRLDIEIDPLYQLWSSKDKNFKKISKHFYGIRLLRQPVIENIFSFICSANNNIKRITKMIEIMSEKYGDKLIDEDDLTIYSFPTVEALSKVEENDLRAFGFGYRAKSIVETARKIKKESQECGIELWINSLESLNYEQSRRKLMTFSGIGPKVADCICLMSLHHTNSVPIDTHVQQITLQFYKDSKELKQLKLSKNNLMTKKNYETIGKFYRNLFGKHAGWAQTVLFCSNLLKKR